MLLWILSWVAVVLMGIFCTICLGAGLFYLAEIAEEFSVQTKYLMKTATQVSEWHAQCHNVRVQAHTSVLGFDGTPTFFEGFDIFLNFR